MDNRNEFADVHKDKVKEDITPEEKARNKKIKKIFLIIVIIIVIISISTPIITFGIMKSQINSLEENKLGEGFGIGDILYNILNVEDRQVKSFNMSILHTGTKIYDELKSLLDNVIIVNAEYEKDVFIEFEDINYTTSTEIMDLQILLSDYDKFKVTHEKDEKGYIIKLIVKKDISGEG